MEKKYKNEIIDDLLSGDIKDEDGIAERAENINFDLNTVQQLLYLLWNLLAKKRRVSAGKGITTYSSTTSTIT